MNWLEGISLVLNLLFGGSLLLTLFTLKSAKEKAKAEAKASQEDTESKAIANDNAVLDLYKRIHTELSKTLADEHDRLVGELEKLSKRVALLEKAIRSVSRCPHSKDCPVTEELEKQKNHIK